MALALLPQWWGATVHAKEVSAGQAADAEVASEEVAHVYVLRYDPSHGLACWCWWDIAVNAEMATLSAKPFDVFLNTFRYDAEEDFETEKCDVSFLAESEYLSI